MNIYSKINQVTHFTQTEKTFVEYIQKHPKDVISLNIKQLAKQSYVSVSTIYRVIEKLELNGLADLKMQLSNHLENYQKEKTETDYNYPFPPHSTHHQIMTKMTSLYDQTIKSTYNLIDLDNFLKVIQALKKANNITVFPSIGNYFMAESFQQNMMEIGAKVDVVSQPFYQHWYTVNAKKDDVVIIISYANRTRQPSLTDVVLDLKKKGVKTIVISSTQAKELSEVADYHLYFCSYEDSEEKIASFSSRISLQYLVDCIYAAYFNTDYEKHIKHKINNYID